MLAVGGITDWLDGKLARLLDQYSRLGALLDPAVDRLYILAALVALGVREIVPWWVVAVLVARDLVLARHACRCCAAAATARSPVTYLGKARDVPAALRVPAAAARAGRARGRRPVARRSGYAFAVWGMALYLWSGLLYLAQFVLALRTPARESPTGATG